MKTLLICLMLGVAATAIACGGGSDKETPAVSEEQLDSAANIPDDDSTGAPSGNEDSGSGVPPGQVRVGDNATPAENLAVIDDGGPLVDKVDVTRFGVLLDRIGAHCSDPPNRLADYIAKTQELLEEEQGVERGVKQIAEEMVDAVAYNDPSTSCQQLFVAYTAAS